MTTRYENPFRPNYESAAAVAWCASAIALLGAALASPLPRVPFLLLASVSLAMALWRGVPALRLRATHRRLKGHPLSFTTLEHLLAFVERNDAALWLGRGFNWSQAHAQLVTDIERRDPECIAPRDTAIKGQRWIHGLGENEDDIIFPISHAEGHTLVAGTNGSGKTQMLSLMAAQFIMRRARPIGKKPAAPEPFLAIDPKNDASFLESVRRSAALVGRAHQVHIFNPSHPQRSVRLDPLKNWSRPTELATRVAALIPSETGADNFTAFGQMAMNAVIGGLLVAHQKPSLVLIRRYLEGEPEQLLIKSFQAYFLRAIGPSYEAELRAYQRSSMTTQELAKALIQYYRERVQTRAPSSDLEGLIGLIEKNREWVGKMLGSLMPVLNLLTSGTLGPLLSPDGDDLEDPRPICDFREIIARREIFVAQLSSLEDSMVASAIGSLLVSDLRAVAGAIYSHEVAQGITPVATNLFIDELEAVVSDPTISLLNRSRGAGFRIVVSTQNALPDLSARMGSEDKARMVLGNLNSLISLRLKDAVTQQYVSENFGKTYVYGVQRSQSTSADSGDPTEFRGSVSESLTESEVELFPPKLLNSLCDLEFVANLSAGRIVKGRCPIVLHGANSASLPPPPNDPRPLPTGADPGPARAIKEAA